MVSYLNPIFPSHTRRVCSLYKKALRNLEAFYDRRNVYRYHAVMLRGRFDANMNCHENAVKLLECGEKEYFEKLHCQPRKFAQSPGGCDFERVVTPPDWVLDYWHPLEKAQYVEYFKCREERKKEYVRLWDEKYNK